MKQKKTIIAIMIIMFAFISGCTPVVETTKEPTETPTVVTPTTTATQTREPTETRQPTATLTHEVTLTPTLKATNEPVIPLPELIQNLDGAMKEEVLNTMQEQYPLNKESGLYRFFCVGGEIITHQPVIQLPTGKEISHTILCQYTDAEGQQVGVHIPIYSYSLQDLNYKVVGFRTSNTADTEEKLLRVVDRNKTALSMEKVATGNSGPNDMTNLGWSGPGHIIYLGFAMPSGEEPTEEELYTQTESGYFNEAIYSLMNEAQLTEFAQTGDPVILPQTADGEPLFLPLNISFENVYGAAQYENRDYDFE